MKKKKERRRIIIILCVSANVYNITKMCINRQFKKKNKKRRKEKTQKNAHKRVQDEISTIRKISKRASLI